jgi:hypothetical protein
MIPEEWINLLAEEVVYGPEASSVPTSIKAKDERLSAERERLRLRLAEIIAELAAPTSGNVPLDIMREPYRRLRHEAAPYWTCPFLALDEEESTLAEGRRLFSEVRAALERHYKFEQPWHGVVCTLFVIQAHIARILPATFYLIIKGRYGGGKTSLLNVIAKLGLGLVFENVSVAALARELKHGRLVCIDEYDVRRSAELQPVLDSIVRQGYRRDAAPYTRYDPYKKEVERLPVYGPKALTIRSFLDPALESRGFIISASPVEGEEAYGFVVRNLWSDTGDLPTRLTRWGANAIGLWSDARFRALAESPEFASKRHRVLEVTGANRDTEQVLVALLTAEVSGVDVATELRAAVELRRASVGTEDAGDIEDVTDAILAVTGAAQDRLTETSPRVRVLFRAIKNEVNRKRKERDDRGISDNRLATVLTQAGVSESWKVRPRNKVGFDLPIEFVRGLREGGPNRTNSPNPVVLDEDVRPVRPVSPTPRGTEPAEPGSWQEGPPPPSTQGEK